MEKEQFVDKVKEYELDIEEAMLYFEYCQKKKLDCATYFDYLQENREYQVKDGKVEEVFLYCINLPIEIDAEIHPIQ